MYTLRCTRRLLARVRAPLVEHTPPTTRLGDWYANLVHIGRMQLVIAVSERTQLPLVVEAAPIAALDVRRRTSLGEVLSALGIARASIDAECAEMAEITYGRTVDRHVNGLLTLFSRELPYRAAEGESLLAMSLMLAGTPCFSSSRDRSIFPDKATQELFGTGRAALH